MNLIPLKKSLYNAKKVKNILNLLLLGDQIRCLKNSLQKEPRIIFIEQILANAKYNILLHSCSHSKLFF